MFKILKNKGFASMVEIIITAIIFVMAAAGIFTTLSMLRPHGENASRRLEAAYVRRHVMEELRGEITPGLWDNAESNLAVGVNHSRIIGGYNVTWWLENVSGLDIRQIHIDINYDEI